MCICILWHRAHFHSCSSLSFESSLIMEHITLLERQLPIEVRSFVDLICLQYWLVKVRVGLFCIWLFCVGNILVLLCWFTVYKMIIVRSDIFILKLSSILPEANSV